MRILENIKLWKNINSITFDEIAQKWIKYKSLSLKESTIASYQYTIDKYLMKYLSNKKILELENYDFNRIILELNQELKPKTVRDIITVLKTILYYAENELGCKFSTNKIQIPKLNGKNVEILSKSEINRLGAYCLKENNLTCLRSICCFKHRIKNRRDMCNSMEKY